MEKESSHRVATGSMNGEETLLSLVSLFRSLLVVAWMIYVFDDSDDCWWWLMTSSKAATTCSGVMIEQDQRKTKRRQKRTTLTKDLKNDAMMMLIGY